MSERKYYCTCDSNCKFETMTKEQILAAIAQAVETGSVGDCDTGFITKVKEQNAGGSVTFWVGTQAQYNALDNKATNCMYIITDDTTTADTRAAFEAAATAAQEAALSAAESAAALAVKDLTKSVSFNRITGGGYDADTVSVSTSIGNIAYYPAQKMLAFTCTVLLTGKMAATEEITLQFVGAPKIKSINARVAANLWHLTDKTKGLQAAVSLRAYENGSPLENPQTVLTVKAFDIIDTGADQCGVAVSGWYYVDPTE